MIRVDKLCGFVVDEADGLIYGDIGWRLGEIGLKVGCDPYMLSSSEIADAADLRATSDNIDNYFWSRLS